MLSPSQPVLWSWQVEYVKVGAVRVSPSAGGAARSLASAVFYVDGEPLPDTADGFEVPHECLALGARVGTQSTPTSSALRYRMFCVVPDTYGRRPRRCHTACRHALQQCRSAACTAAGASPSAAGEADRFHLSDLSPPAAACIVRAAHAPSAGTANDALPIAPSIARRCRHGFAGRQQSTEGHLSVLCCRRTEPRAPFHCRRTARVVVRSVANALRVARPALDKTLNPKPPKTISGAGVTGRGQNNRTNRRNSEGGMQGVATP